MKTSIDTDLPSDLSQLKKLLFEKCRLTMTAVHEESESEEYSACSFKLNQKQVIFRVSKITPKKVGQFVTVWKRNQKGITQPFSKSDDLDYTIICSRSGANFGAFIFSKDVLIEKGIVTDKKEGKRGIRVYPPWDRAVNKQAEKTQQWQTKYFIKLDGKTVDVDFVKSLFV